MNKNFIYMDNSATTPVDKTVLRSMQDYFNKDFGNAGSMHNLGLKAENALDQAREKVSKILNCNPNEIIFTGSGTESINLAIKGVVKKLQKNRRPRKRRR